MAHDSLGAHSDGGLLESPRAKWARVVITESTQWKVVCIEPSNLVETMQQQCGGHGGGSSIPLVFLLKAGLYRLHNSVTIHRSAPCVFKAEEAGVYFELDPPNDVAQENRDAPSSTSHAAAQSILYIRGKGDVVMQGISFRSPVPGYSCLHAGGTGRVCVAECKFSAAPDDTQLTCDGACVTLSSSVGCFYSTQCEFTSGDVGLRAVDSLTEGIALPLDPLSVVLEDAGFGMAPSLDEPSVVPLRHGVQLHCRRPVHLVVDHSAFDHITLSALETSASNPSAGSADQPQPSLSSQYYKQQHHHTMTLQHSTISSCGSSSAAAVVMKGHHALEVLDCTLEQCGLILLGHSSTCRLVESSLVWRSNQQHQSLATTSPSGDSFRFLVAQDQANVTVEKCEWSLIHSNVSGSSSWTSTFLTLLSTGHVLVEGNLFHQKGMWRGGDLDESRGGVLLSSIVVSGSSAPIIRGNRFNVTSSDEMDNIKESPESPPMSPTSVVVGLLLGLWHDAKISDNTFSESIDPSAAFVSLEDHPECAGIASKLDESVMEAWAPRKVTVLQPEEREPALPNEATHVVTISSSDDAPQRAATSARSRSHNKKVKGSVRPHPPPQRPPAPTTAPALSKRVPRCAAAAAATRSTAKEAEAIHYDDADHDAQRTPLSEAATIATLREEVAALKLQLHDARTSTTMTDSHGASARPPSSKRPTSARPSSAKHSNPNSRPSSAKSRGGDGARSPRQHSQSNPNSHSDEVKEDDKIVRVGHHEWNMSRIKAFMQGRLPLADVRRDAPVDEKSRHMSPKRSNSPTAIYDAWKQNQAEKRDEEERLLRRLKEEEHSHRRKLTPRQQSEMVHRIHTESIEHLKEVRATWELDALGKLQRPRFATMKMADAIAEAEGDFDERLSKDLRDRKLRKEILMRKYVPEITTNVRPRSEIEAYASSMHKGHHDAKLIAKLNDDTGLQLKVVPPRSGYKERPSSAKRVRLEDQVAYCASLHTSHRNEQLAEKAAKIIGDDCVVRVGARSSSRGPASSHS
jgi:hypothetical protein